MKNTDELKLSAIVKKDKEGKNRKIQREAKQKGITLIALVITIIVLLILAGVTIATLTGENGILTRASEASIETRGATVEERKDLWKVEQQSDNYLTEDTAQTLDELLDDLEAEDLITPEERTQIEETGYVTIGSRNIIFTSIPLPSTEETTPYYPDDNCRYVEGNLDSGLVIADENGNEYVWIEVPKSITKNANTKDELYNVLNTYSIDYKDTWDWGLTNSDIWYEGCGLSEEEYNNNYMKMLNSIKENGGFYIGRYEMGSLEPRTETSNATQSAIKIDMYPYNWVTIEEAENICETYSLGDRTSSLMYDIQYNLACKFLEVKSDELTVADIAEDSEKWGNYYGHDMKLNRGKYAIYDSENYMLGEWKDYTENSEAVENSIKKNEEKAMITTGASEENRILNIYDFTGNVFCYTLGNYQNGSPGSYLFPVIRGGYYGDYGTYMAASWNSWSSIEDRYEDIGFRNCIY